MGPCGLSAGIVMNMNNRKWLVVAAVALVLVLAGGLVAKWRYDLGVARERVSDAKLPLDALLSTIRGVWLPGAELKAEIEKRLKFELASFKIPIQKATRADDWAAIDRTIARFEQVCPESLKGQLDGLKKFRVEREEAADVAALENLVGRDRPYGEPARRFVERYPKSGNLARVQQWIARAEQRAEARERAELEKMPCTTREELDAKLGAIAKFLEKFPHVPEATEMRRAAEVATKLSRMTSVKLKLSGAGRFNGKRSFSVKLFVDGALKHEVFSEGDAQEATWDKELALEWSPGKPIAVVLYDYQWRNETAATREQTGLLAVRGIEGRRDLEPQEGWEPYFEGKPWVAIETPDVSAEEWALLEAHVTGSPSPPTL
jgi:hypothetical protein